MLQYLFNVLNGLDRFANAVAAGDPRMTLSARMGRDRALGICRLCRPICGFLDLFQKDHCAKAWASEQVAVDASMQLTKE